ncbi:MAG TPA: hypothetical protein ENL08_04060 [Bacteroidetes bacterium]|nr:hypothetical protein [Bacteroidota bacterium]
MPDLTGAMEFVQRQLGIFRQQYEAVARGDLVAAKSAGDQLLQSLPGLVQIVNHSRNGGQFSASERESLERIVAEIKTLLQDANKCILAKRQELAELLFEFRRGRQLLTGYRSGRDSGGRLFEVIG